MGVWGVPNRHKIKFNYPLSCYTTNIITSLLMLIALNSVFKHIGLNKQNQRQQFLYHLKFKNSARAVQEQMRNSFRTVLDQVVK